MNREELATLHFESKYYSLSSYVYQTREGKFAIHVTITSHEEGDRQTDVMDSGVVGDKSEKLFSHEILAVRAMVGAFNASIGGVLDIRMQREALIAMRDELEKAMGN